MIRIGVDVGGTFTDFVLLDDAGGAPAFFFKLPSTPHDPSVSIAEGVRTLIALAGRDPGEVGFLGHGTTVATNMVIERRGVVTGLVTTRGFRDVLAVGRQTRPALYDYAVRKPEPLVERHRRLEADERIDSAGEVLTALDPAQVESLARTLVASGAEAIAVCFLHAYRNPAHERAALAAIERAVPGVYVSVSSDVLPEFREFERTSTTVVNAYVGPRMRDYLDRLRARIREAGIAPEPYTFHSNGGLLPVRTAERLPVLTCLSGPAAGVVGSAAIGAQAGIADIITFDVGGTSTDVSLISAGRPRYTSQRDVAGYPVKMPMTDIHVIGAGGGSIARVDSAGALAVGPASAGAVPGPIAYGRGGVEPTLTDANIVLGRLNPTALLEGRMPVERARAAEGIERLVARPLGLTLEQAACGILTVAVANMSRAIRSVSTEHGHDPAEFCLFAFGGAGPLHAAEVAMECGIRRILVPLAPGTLCARGILLSDVSRDFVRTRLARLDAAAWRDLVAVFETMRREADAWLDAERIVAARRVHRLAIDARYRGQSHEIRVPLDTIGTDGLDAFLAAFHRAHRLEYGHDLPDLPVEAVNCRVQAVGTVERVSTPPVSTAAVALAPPHASRQVYFADTGWRDTPVRQRARLDPGTAFDGPAIVEEMSATTVVLPGQRLRVDPHGNLLIES